MMNLVTGFEDSHVQSNRGERDRNYCQAQCLAEYCTRFRISFALSSVDLRLVGEAYMTITYSTNTLLRSEIESERRIT